MLTMTETSSITIYQNRICKHPNLNILVRSDGYVLLVRSRKEFLNKTCWTLGSLMTNGYYAVNYNSKRMCVHRIVAETFLPNPENKPTVDHIDRNRSNNAIEPECNLRWATWSENNLNNARCDSSLEKYGVRRSEDNNAYHRALYASWSEDRKEARRARIRQNRAKKSLSGCSTTL